MFKSYFLLLPILALGACTADTDDRLKERVKVESETAAQQQTEAERAAQNARAAEMEMDLAQRHRFFQAVKGAFEGGFMTDLGEFKFRILMMPSLSPAPTDRRRLPEEVASDLNNLYFNAQIQMWSAKNPASASGCRVENLRPDIKTGTMAIISANCPNSYLLTLSTPAESVGLSDEQHYKRLLDEGISARLAGDIVSSRLNRSEEIAGFLRLTNLAVNHYFRAKRVSQ
jgi:hypothetical protein